MLQIELTLKKTILCQGYKKLTSGPIFFCPTQFAYFEIFPKAFRYYIAMHIDICRTDMFCRKLHWQKQKKCQKNI